jgi:Na+/melibiose symporter-like transporter
LTPPDLEWRGVLLTCFGLGGLIYAGSLVSQPATPWISVAIIGSTSVVLLVGTVRHLLRAPDPLLDLRLLGIRTFRVAIGSGSLSRMALNAVPFLLPLLFENIFGWSPVKSGSIVLFVFVGNIGIKPATSFLINRFGFRTVLLAAGVGLAASLVCAGVVSKNTPIIIIIIITLFSGVARSVGGTSYTTLIFCDVADSQMSHANTLAATCQQLSLGLGVCIATIALRLGTPIGNWLPGQPTAKTAYLVAFLLMALLPLGGIVGVLLMPRDAGDAARRRAVSPASGTVRSTGVTPETGVTRDDSTDRA